MNHFVLAAALVCFGSQKALAATEVYELPISSATQPAAISIASAAWTNATPAAVKLTDMAGIAIGNPSSNARDMFGFLSDCTTPTYSTTSIRGPFEIPVATVTAGGYKASFIPMTEDMCLWLVGRHTAAEAVTVQGVKRRR